MRRGEARRGPRPLAAGVCRPRPPPRPPAAFGPRRPSAAALLLRPAGQAASLPGRDGSAMGRRCEAWGRLGEAVAPCVSCPWPVVGLRVMGADTAGVKVSSLLPVWLFSSSLNDVFVVVVIVVWVFFLLKVASQGFYGRMGDFFTWLSYR